MERQAPGLLEAVHAAVLPRGGSGAAEGATASGAAPAHNNAAGCLRWNYGGLVLCRRALEQSLAPRCLRDAAPAHVACYASMWTAACHATGGTQDEATWPLLPRACDTAPGLQPALDVLALAPDAVEGAVDTVSSEVEWIAGAAQAPQRCGAVAAATQTAVLLMWAALRCERVHSQMGPAAVEAFRRACNRITATVPAALAGDVRLALATQECERLLARLNYLFPT